MPLSRVDLPKVVEALRNLFRVVENPRADTSWVAAAFEEMQCPPLPVPLPEVLHSYLTDVAGQLVMYRLMPSGVHDGNNCADITESSLDLEQKTALLKIRDQLKLAVLRRDLARNRSFAVCFLGDLEKTLPKLGNTEGRPTPADAVRVVEGAAGQASPAALLFTWREILTELNMAYNNENRRHVTDANNRYEGPILLGKKGAQPKVAKAKLIEWWDGLAARWQTQNRAADKEATVQARHSYGREGNVVPDIAGHEKKRRAKKG